jgi:low affinity Fe/Cu permease
MSSAAAVPENSGQHTGRPPLADVFARGARRASRWLGTPWAFFVAIAVVVVWAAAGPLAHYSTAWQLVINTGTTIVTFLMVFIIQNTQNRETTALQLKLDELLRATTAAHSELIDLEEMSEADLDRLHHWFQEISLKAGVRTAPAAPEAAGDLPPDDPLPDGIGQG